MSLLSEGWRALICISSVWSNSIINYKITTIEHVKSANMCTYIFDCAVINVFIISPSCMQPTPQRIRPEHAQTLERYTWESTEETNTGEKP